MEPLVSVIIPVYNAGAYLRTCLDSVLRQTLGEIEVICVDDGSTDGSPLILEEYKRRDSRLRVYTQGRLSAGAARNYGLQLAGGKYLSFLDADDFFEADMLETAVQRAEKENSDLVVFRFCNYDNNLKEKGERRLGLNTELLPPEGPFSAADIPDTIFTFTNIAVWNKLYRREFVQSHGIRFQSLKNSNDLYFAIAALAAAERISAIDRCFVYYRVNNPYSIQGNHDDSPLEFGRALEALWEKLKGGERWRLLERSMVNLCLSIGLAKLRAGTLAVTFETVYQFLKDRLFPLCGMGRYEQSFFYSPDQYAELKKIESDSVAEYLFALQKQKSGRTEEERRARYLFPYTLVRRGSDIVLYGAGMLGRTFKRLLEATGYCRVVLWADQNDEKLREEGLEVAPAGQIGNVRFDYLVIAVLDQALAAAVRDELAGEGIAEYKIIWRDERIENL